MMKNLECSSRGDKRFSALYAIVTVNGHTASIEQHYQQAKRGLDGKPTGKGKGCAYIVVYGRRLPSEYLTPWYKFLWFLYLKHNPELLEVINRYDTFTDMFRGHSINCQADVIAAVREGGLEALVPDCKRLKRALENAEEAM